MDDLQRRYKLTPREIREIRSQVDQKIEAAVRTSRMPGHTMEATMFDLLLDAEARYWRAMRAFESLTPGGSEFVDDPMRCKTFIDGRLTSMHRRLLDLSKPPR